ncbi:ABC transporter ATP-binding protein [Piscinibacter sakaiensis]|uniref:AttE component of AttEFGH ABC transport system n=1 Tax=Piscinibacter sakaiensis TaxID=1547922 RepID=A0A0K8P6L8_PISS1|nr:ABC transporter ATP-binding protein [Piscinibacter sakaiensis]GAP38257.1 AttE component of AttEFGH ABC transport system [Piscinibacter sakaiensis]
MLEVRGLVKRHGGLPVFHGVDLAVASGEFVAVLGESGVGKSTLLNCIAGLEPADGGEIVLAGQRLRGLGDEALARLRREQLGFVFQAFHVLPHLDVAQNIGLPLRLLGRRDEAGIADRVGQMLDQVGLGGLGTRLPQTLSGGQLQRVAIARALVHRPRLILADEPTGNLDPATAATVMDLLVDQVHAQGAACVLVTHSRAAAARADRVRVLHTDGLRAAAAD